MHVPVRKKAWILDFYRNSTFFNSLRQRGKTNLKTVIREKEQKKKTSGKTGENETLEKDRGGGCSPKFSENQFIVEGRKKKLRDIKLPLSHFLPPSSLLFLLLFHPTHVTQPFKDLKVPMSSSVHHVAVPRSSTSGLGGAAEARMGVQLISVRHLCLIVFVYRSYGCVCVCTCHTHIHMQAPMCAKHRPHTLPGNSFRSLTGEECHSKPTFTKADSASVYMNAQRIDTHGFCWIPVVGGMLYITALCVSD